MSSEESELVSKGPCEDCGAWEAKAYYSDGHSYCFACPPDEAYKKASSTTSPPGRKDTTSMTSSKPTKDFNKELASLLETAEVRALSKWKITQATCRHWGYYTRLNSKGEGEHISVYKNEAGQPVFAKIRNVGKDGNQKKFWALGNEDEVSLYGVDKLGNGGKMVIVAEGEKDTLCASQLWACKFPVVGLPFGAGSSTKAISKVLGKLCKYDKIIIATDMDKAGKEGAEALARLFPPGKVFLPQLTSNDIHQMFLDEGPKAVISALHNAQAYRPDGIVEAKDLVKNALEPTITGISFPYGFMTEWTYGLRPGEIVVIGAGTGIGKSDLAAEIAAHFIRPKDQGGVGIRCAVFNYEASPTATLVSIAGKLASKRLHIPNPEGDLWTPQEKEEALNYLITDCAKLFINDHFGAVDWESVKERTRYLRHAEDVRAVFVDPVAALVAQMDDERKGLDNLFAEAKSFAEELGVNFIFNSHLTRPSQGPAHEEGGRVELKHFRGSNAISMWSSFCFGMERDSQAEEEEERATATIRVIKDRFTGNSLGKTRRLIYNLITGRYEETTLEMDQITDNPPPPSS